MNMNIEKPALKIRNSIENQARRIPTRFDDITNEIAAEKMEKYYRQNEQKIISTYTLGNVLSQELGNLLNKVI